MKLSRENYNLLVDCVSIHEDRPHDMSQFEIDFMTGKGPNGQYDSLIEKFEKYGEDVKLSDKQIAVLQRMYDRIIEGKKGGRK